MKPKLGLLGAVAVLLAAQSATGSAASTAGSPAFTVGFHLTASFPYGLVQGEPTIKSDSGGRLYVMAPGSTPIGCELWTVASSGQSATFHNPPDLGVGGGDCDLAISATTAAGGSYPTVSYSSLSLPNITVGMSTDGAQTFSTPNPVADQVVGDDRQWMAAGAGSTVYLSSHLLASDNIGVSRSTDGGQTYLFQGLAIDASHIAQAAYNNELGPLVVDTASLASPQPLYTIFTAPSTAVANLNTAAGTTQSANNGVYLASSLDGGATWTDSTIYIGPADETYDHIFPALSVDAGGNLWAAWASASHIYVSHAAPAASTTDSTTTTSTTGTVTTTTSTTSVDVGASLVVESYQAPSSAGLSWTVPVQMDQTGATANLFPWIVGGSAGRADLVWYAGTASTYADPSNQWVVRFAGLHTTPQGLSVAQAVASDHVIHAGPICTTGVTCSVNGNRTLLDFFTDTLLPDGRAAIAWTDDSQSPGIGQIYVTVQCAGTSATTGKLLDSTC